MAMFVITQRQVEAFRRTRLEMFAREVAEELLSLAGELTDPGKIDSKARFVLVQFERAKYLGMSTKFELKGFALCVDKHGPGIEQEIVDLLAPPPRSRLKEFFLTRAYLAEEA